MAAAVEELPDILRGERVGSTRVSDVRVKWDQDSAGLLALFIILMLSNPKKGQATWPVDHLWELRRVVRSRVREVAPDLDAPWFVAFEPEEADELDPDDRREQVEVDV